MFYKFTLCLYYMKFKLIIAILILFISIVSAQPNQNTEVWFTPNSGSVDMLNLFNNPEQWTSSRAIVDVYGFYAVQAEAPFAQYPCTICGQNILPNLINTQAFSKLVQWNKKISVEVSVVKPFACTYLEGFATPSQRTAYITQHIINNIESNGGTVEYLVMDEPLTGGAITVTSNNVTQQCNYNLEQTADAVAEYISIVRAIYPSVKFVLVEPYPDPILSPTPQNPISAQGSVIRLQQFITALEARGVQLHAFHLDVNSEAATAWTTNLATDLNTLKQFFASPSRTNPIRFGVIFNENINYQAQTNQQYYTATLNFLNNVKNIIGVTEDVVFQSWHDLNDPLKQLPSNLPENTSYTHTNLIINGWQALGGTLPNITSASQNTTQGQNQTGPGTQPKLKKEKIILTITIIILVTVIFVLAYKLIKTIKLRKKYKYK